MANSKRKCKQCKEYIMAEVGIKVPAGFFCSIDHAFEFTNEARQRKNKKLIQSRVKQDKVDRAQIKERKKALKTMAELKSEAQTWFNKFIRLSDPFSDCCSCDRTNEEIIKNDGWKLGGCFDAGHFHSRAARPDLRYVEDNCWRQCKSCNAGSGKYGAKQKTVSVRYTEKLIERIGASRVAALDLDNGPVKWTREELIGIANTYKLKCKEL
jgi:hypothetical protein